MLLRCRKGIGKTYMGTEIVKEKRGQPAADNQCVTKKSVDTGVDRLRL